jgi:hypothetical protein
MGAVRKTPYLVAKEQNFKKGLKLQHLVLFSQQSLTRAAVTGEDQQLPHCLRAKNEHDH